MAARHAEYAVFLENKSYNYHAFSHLTLCDIKQNKDIIESAAVTHRLCPVQCPVSCPVCLSDQRPQLNILHTSFRTLGFVGHASQKYMRLKYIKKIFVFCLGKL